MQYNFLLGVLYSKLLLTEYQKLKFKSIGKMENRPKKKLLEKKGGVPIVLLSLWSKRRKKSPPLVPKNKTEAYKIIKQVYE